MSRSVRELEQEIEESRARLDRRIDQIQDRLTVSGMVDEFVGSTRGSATNALVDRALGVVRRHPIPVVLAAAGIGLLLQRLGQDRKARADNARHPPRAAGASRPDELEEDVIPVLRPARRRDYDPDLPTGRAQADGPDMGPDLDARA